jgi:microcystin-dependent protein
MADNYQPTLAINFLVTLSGGGAFPGSEPTENGDPGYLTIGMLRMMAYGSEQSYARYANGQTLPINQNQPLFSVLGNEFGGNPANSLALPDLRDLVIVGSDAGGTDFAEHLGSSTTAVLSQAELPASAGGGGSTSNMQPSLALSYLIRVSDTGQGLPAGGSFSMPATPRPSPMAI